jgi:hypothetical protein
MHKEEHEIELNSFDKTSLKAIVKEACKRFGYKEKAAICKFYNRKGIEMLKDDAQFFKQGDIFYAALEGKYLSHHLLIIHRRTLQLLCDPGRLRHPALHRPGRLRQGLPSEA